MADQTNTAICTCGETSGKPFCMVHGEPRYRYVTDPVPDLVAEIDRLRADLATANSLVSKMADLDYLLGLREQELAAAKKDAETERIAGEQHCHDAMVVSRENDSLKAELAKLREQVDGLQHTCRQQQELIERAVKGGRK